MQKTSEQLLTQISALHPRLIDLSLRRMTRALKALNNPEKNLPPIIHVAGSNGKGSTIAFLSAMLEAAGKSHHRYHSPHLLRFHERILLHNKEISEQELVRVLEQTLAANAQEEITFFELTTAAAFCAFASKPADYLLLEVGLGGRLDATNVITPRLAAITRIALDHQEFLGDTIEKIAGEKAGIIKNNVPIISAPQTHAVADIIRAHAETQNAPLFLGGQDWQSSQERDRLIYEDQNGLLDLPLPPLAGAHQHENAGVAIACARALNLDEKAIATGLEHTIWAGRLQPLNTGKLARTHSHLDIWLDGAHNPDGARALAHWLRDSQKDARETHLIVGMLANKDARAFFENLKEGLGDAFTKQAPQIYTLTIPEQKNAAPAEALAAAAQEAGFCAKSAPTLDHALAQINKPAHKTKHKTVIAGSLYLLGFVLAQN